MCLDNVTPRTKKPTKIIGWRVCRDHGNGLYGPLHQGTYMRFRVGLDYH